MKFSKRQRKKQNRALEIADDRLSAFGIVPKKFKKQLKYTDQKLKYEGL